MTWLSIHDKASRIDMTQWNRGGECGRTLWERMIWLFESRAEIADPLGSVGLVACVKAGNLYLASMNGVFTMCNERLTSAVNGRESKPLIPSQNVLGQRGHLDYPVVALQRRTQW